MRILEILCTLGSGGAERFVVDLSNELSRSQEVILLTVKDDNLPGNSFYLPELSPSVRHICAGRRGRMGLGDMLSVLRIARSLHPDLIHLHGSSARFAVLAIMFLGRKVKIVETIHSDIRDGYSDFPWKFFFPLFGDRGIVSYVTISTKNYNDLSKAHPRCSNTLIFNGRALPVLTGKAEDARKEMDSFRKDDGTVLFIHVARYAPVKDQKLLFDSFRILQEQGRDISLAVIGSRFSEGPGAELAATAPSCAHFLGTRSNVFDYMAAADAFVLSSLSEGMPISVIEALMSGLPVVSTPVCGAVDVVRPGENGILAAGHSVDEFVTALSEFLNTREEIAGRISGSDAAASFRMDKCALKYLELFEKLLSK